MFRLELNSSDPLLLPADLPVVIGRGDQCDLQLDDPSASRVHCRVLASGGKVRITDLSSRWGTFVNGQRVEECDLRPGDRVRVGETVLKLEAEAEAGRTTLARESELDRPDSTETIAPGYGGGHIPQESFAVDEDAQPVHHADADVSADALTPLESSQFVGQKFLRYRVQETIATTDSGIVFRATESKGSRPVALKIFHPAFFANDVDQQRFERASKTMFGLRHPHIVELYNAGRSDGHCFTASQLVEGETAVDLIRRVGVAGMLDPSTVLQIAVDLCAALQFAEGRNIVHRNIKPSNILITDAHAPSGDSKRRVTLLNDLILAKASTNSGAEKLTEAGDIIGDVGYMSPEQLGSGHPIDCRSDIYQLGVTLYALLTGREAFSGGSMGERIRQVLTQEPDPVKEFHMATPPQFDTLVLKMLKKNPNERFQNADELAAALRKVAAETGQRDIKPIVRNADDPGWGGALDGLL